MAKPPTPSTSPNPTPSASPSQSQQSGTTPLIPASHTPTPAQKAPEVRKTLAPYIPEANPNAPKDPAQELARRQREAIASRVGDQTRSKVASSAVDVDTGKTPSPIPLNISKGLNERKTSGSPDPASTQSAKSDSTAPSSDSEDSSGGDTDSSTSESAEPSSSEATAEASTSTSKRSPRYDIKSMKKWAEENPEAADEIRQHVFGGSEDLTPSFIKLQNKRRKVREETAKERAETVAAAQKELDEARAHKEHVESRFKVMDPVLDLWEGATRKDQGGNAIPDFDMVDAAFERTARMPLNEYLRLRARRGVTNPEQAALRVENARLKAQLQQSNGAAAAQPAATTPQAPKGAAAEKAPPPPQPAAAPAGLSSKWGEDIPKAHPIRKFAGWEQQLDAAMSQYHDEALDEYSRDPADVANNLVKRMIAEFSGEDETDEEPARPRPAKKKPATDRPKKASFAPPDLGGVPSPEKLTPKVDSQRAFRKGAREGFEDLGSSDNPRDPHIRDRPDRWSDRVNWAIQRAQQAARSGRE